MLNLLFLVKYFSPITDFNAALIMSYCRLHELNEHIEVLEAAIDFKNDSIASKHLDMREIVESGVTGEIDQKFEQLSLNDARMLLARYFNKVVHLKVTESHHRQQQRELEVKISEQQETIHRLGRTLKQAEVEKERRLLAQQKVCMELKISYCHCVCMLMPPYPIHMKHKGWCVSIVRGVSCYLYNRSTTYFCLVFPKYLSAPKNSQLASYPGSCLCGEEPGYEATLNIFSRVSFCIPLTTMFYYCKLYSLLL